MWGGWQDSEAGTPDLQVQAGVREGGKAASQADKVSAGSASWSLLSTHPTSVSASASAAGLCEILPTDTRLSVRHLPSSLLHMHGFEEKPLNSQTG